MSDVNLNIDGIPVSVPRGTTLLEAAKKANITIPILCEHPELNRRAICRLCVVEADGGSKLLAACANTVWEGANIVTSNQRLFMVRKTIIELILANHPQDCLSCVRSKKCELQTLAANYGLTVSPFENESKKNKPIIENETIVRDMDKCVKCNRCVEVCQEIQEIRSINTSCRSHDYEINTAYKQSLYDTPCVFCGGCAAICPVGAIYGHDQTAEVWKALNDSSVKKMAQVAPALVSVMERELGVTLTIGKVVTAIKMLGFDKVYEARIAINAISSEICNEVQARKGKLPVISGCSDGVTRFIKHSYPDLEANLTSTKNLRQMFSSLFKAGFARETGTDVSKITSVLFVPCITQKYAVKPDKTDFALSISELVRMVKLAGIVIQKLPEEPFDSVNCDLPKPGNPVKKEQVHGYANARKVMEDIRSGKCDLEWVEIMSCPAGKGCVKT